jgi:hypothetical protein
MVILNYFFSLSALHRIKSGYVEDCHDFHVQITPILLVFSGNGLFTEMQPVCWSQPSLVLQELFCFLGNSIDALLLTLFNGFVGSPIEVLKYVCAMHDA